MFDQLKLIGEAKIRRRRHERPPLIPSFKMLPLNTQKPYDDLFAGEESNSSDASEESLDDMIKPSNYPDVSKAIERVDIDPDIKPVPRSLPRDFIRPVGAKVTGILGLVDEKIELIVSPRLRPYTTLVASWSKAKVLVFRERPRFELISLKRFKENFPFMCHSNAKYQEWLETGKLPSGQTNQVLTWGTN